MNLRQVSNVRDMPVLDLEAGAPLGRVVNWVVNPRDQRIAAWLLNKSRLLQAQPAIVPADIAEYGPHMLVARDRQTVIAPSEVVGLPELITNQMSVVGFRATTDQGQILGTVTDIIFDTISAQIQTYYIRPQTLTGLLQNDLVLPASRVTKIEPKRVVFGADVVSPPPVQTQEQIQAV